MASPPAKTPDRHYDFRAMNVVFALSALAFLLVTVFMVVKDFARPWKRFQAEFRDLERQQVVAELEAERAQINNEQMQAVQQEIAAEQQRLQSKQGEVDALDDEITTLGKRVFEADARMRARKSNLDAAKYRYDHAIQEGGEGGMERAREHMESLSQQWQEDTVALQEFQAQLDERRAALETEQAALEASEQKLSDLNKALNGLNTRLAGLEKDIDYFMLNAPLMDFLQPTLKIEQVILPGLYHDINFAKIERVDRCMTCHAAANRGGFDGEEWASPFRSHPRLDLYVGDGSPHPYSQFGCTACHAGLDRATDFARAGHTPTDEEQLQHWEADYDWEAQKYLETPIYPADMSESGCISCHADEVWTPGSDTAGKGRQLITKMGCYGCHTIDYAAYRDLPKSGPDLRKVASKIEPEFASKWIEAPRDFRATTWMPHFFFEENIEGELNEARQHAEIEGIVDYLWSVSETPRYPGVPVAGNASRGEELFNSVGCTGCHIRDADAKREDYYDNLQRLHGPNLVGVGSKVAPDWLFAWLKNPRQYRPDTAMPNLRLSEQEAADLVAYLTQSRVPDFDGGERPAVDTEARDGLLLGYLQNTMTIQHSEERLAGMSELDRSVYLGKQTIAKYGCFACHEIQGFEDTKPIGVELTEEASKPVHLFDFGHVHDVPHTHADWIRTKLQRPRIWDEGRQLVKNYDELYRMPNFGMSDREANAVTSIVLGFRKEQVREERKAGQGSRSRALAAGRKVVTRYNCQGCHLVEGEGHAIRTAMENADNLPPNLAATGARVQSDWLFSFLHDPSQVTLRPWLSVRMPTFQFGDEELNTLVSYFAALDGAEAFATQPAPRSDESVALGGQIFSMLQCAKCHPSGPGAVADSGGATGELAPSLLIAKERLRFDWVPEWIKDPQSFVPGTKMPTNFPEQNGEFQSYLPQGVDTPPFADHKRRMLQYFSSEEELMQYLNDVDQVTRALRDYIWSL